MSELIVTRMQGKSIAFLMENQKAYDIQLLSSEEEILGNVYIGKVKKIVKNLQAAFVEIKPGQECYYPIAENPKPIYTSRGNAAGLAVGDEIAVQVIRESQKMKPPAVSSEITIAGRYLVLISSEERIRFSGKLPLEDRDRIRKIFEETCDHTRHTGVIVRTNCAGVEAEVIRNEWETLNSRYEKLLLCASTRTCFSCIYQKEQGVEALLRDQYFKDVNEIITDQSDFFEELKTKFAVSTEAVPPVRFYQDSLLPLYKCYSLERQLDLVFQKKVWLKSGGFLVIEPTEALTVIDVNSGKYDGPGKKKEETFHRINLEAAAEAARQIRLRNLSGMILIDFINESNGRYQEELLKKLDGYLRSDPVKTVLIDITKLNLVEITRKKMKKTLWKQWSTGEDDERK